LKKVIEYTINQIICCFFNRKCNFTHVFPLRSNADTR